MKTKIVLSLLLGLLALAASAHASFSPPTAVPLVFEEELEAEVEEEGEYEEGECAEAEAELSEGELSAEEVAEICEEDAEDKEAGGGGNPPAECLLRTFHPQAVADASQDKVKLTIGYTTYEPVDATVEIREGNDRIGSIHRHLGRSGVLRIVERPEGKRMAKRLVIRFRIPGTAPSCGKSQTKTAVVR